MKYNVVIVGAGAAGLTTAYRISKEKPELSVLVLERLSVAGKKLSASGNGKCNVTNRLFEKQMYYCSEQVFIDKWIKHSDYQDVIDFFHDMGILLYEKNGYFYPFSNQAKQVTEYLLACCKNTGVDFIYDTEVYEIKSQKQTGYEIKTKQKNGNEKKYTADTVFLCAGGCAAPKLGGTDCGYKIVKKLGIKTTKMYPALTPAYVDDKDLHIAKGVRIDACVTLKGADGFQKKEIGQLQINDNNLSGIAMMNLSCIFNGWDDFQRKDCLWLDVLPDLSWEELKEYIVLQCKKMPLFTMKDMLSALFPTKFACYLLKRVRIDFDLPLKSLSEKQMNRLVSNIKKLIFTPIALTDYEKAQVTAGGVSVFEINDFFESTKYEKLFLLGEMLDVHGRCGGYNLSFAFLSAIQATTYYLKTCE